MFGSFGRVGWGARGVSSRKRRVRGPRDRGEDPRWCDPRHRPEGASGPGAAALSGGCFAREARSGRGKRRPMNRAREAELAALSSEVRELLVRRAERIRTPNAAPADADDEVMWVATFRLGDQEYSIPLSALRAAIPRRIVTSVPGAPRAVLGILQFRGEIITALSMAFLLEIEGHAPTPLLLVVDLRRAPTLAT